MKYLSFVLAAALAVCAFAACGGSPAEAPAVPDAAGTAAEPDGSGAGRPEDGGVLSSFEKRTIQPVTILTSNNINSTIHILTSPEEESAGDIVNDALADRDRQLEEYFSSEIVWKTAPTDGDLEGIFRSDVLAGDDTFDFMIGAVNNVSVPVFNKQLCRNLTDLPHIDLPSPWWSRNVMENFIYNGSHCMLVGEFSPRNMLAGNMLIFNIKMRESLGLPSPYDMVRDGSWTYDRFKDIVKGVGSDLNGNGKADYGDIFGLACDSTTAHSFYFGMGGTLTDREMKAAVTETKSVSVLEDLQNFFAGSDVDCASYAKNTYLPNEEFMDGNVLFNCMVIIDLSTFRDTETDYGVVPLPKYDEAQSGYISLGNTNVIAAVTIPVTVPDDRIDSLGLFIEAMTKLSHYVSVPEAYEATLLTKETRDEESVEMLRVVTESLTFDFGYVYNIGGIRELLVSVVYKGKPLLSSYEKISGRIEKEGADLAALFTQE